MPPSPEGGKGMCKLGNNFFNNHPPDPPKADMKEEKI